MEVHKLKSELVVLQQILTFTEAIAPSNPLLTSLASEVANMKIENLKHTYFYLELT